MTVGVVVMAYGTPARRDDVLEYYTDIRRGRPPTDEQLADLVRRYDAIAQPGHDSLSPLRAHTERQAMRIAAALGPGYTVEVGLKHADPRIEDAVMRLAKNDAERIVGLVLAPHYSSMSVGGYLERAERMAETNDVGFSGIESWATEPAFVDYLARDVTRRLAAMPDGTRVVFTAHSLPERIIVEGDPYPDELTSTASAVASAAGLAAERWSIGWQSAGRTPEPWIGPDILTVIDALAADGGPGVLVCPCGFVADHLEVLYDLDIEARRRAEAAGMAFDRTASVNDDPAVMAALAELIRRS
jgi:protoporphyrin/coproporphyrin ferrochelatase